MWGCWGGGEEEEEEAGPKRERAGHECQREQLGRGGWRAELWRIGAETGGSRDHTHLPGRPGCMEVVESDGGQVQAHLETCLLYSSYTWNSFHA